MLTWILSITIAGCFLASGISYAIISPRHKASSKKSSQNGTVFVNNKGISMDEREVYSIPYEDYNL